MLIEWDEADKIFTVTIPEWVDRVRMPCTHGKSYEEAARMGLEVIETFLEIWEEESVAGRLYRST